MTAQIHDTIIWKRLDFDIVYFDLTLFNPLNYGINPESLHTACYRGFYCQYKLINKSLYLHSLTIRNDKGRYPLINGVKSELCKHKNRITRATYTNLKLPIKKTGVMRIGNGFIRGLFQHMGFQEAIAYNTLMELSFVNGKLQSAKDLSSSAESLRKAQNDVECFLKQNWVPKEYQHRLRRSYGLIEYDDIDRTFNPAREPLQANDVYQILNEIKIEQKSPRWLIINYLDYYERQHQYYFSFQFLRLLGCTNHILNILIDMKLSGYPEEDVILAFLETLRVKIVGDLWGDTLSYWIEKLYLKANIDSTLKIAIKNTFHGITLNSWPCIPPSPKKKNKEKLSLICPKTD